MTYNAEVWYWTPSGMTQRLAFTGESAPTAYVTKEAAERMLEQAHAHGVEAGERALRSQQAWQERRG